MTCTCDTTYSVKNNNAYNMTTKKVGFLPHFNAWKTIMSPSIIRFNVCIMSSMWNSYNRLYYNLNWDITYSLITPSEGYSTWKGHFIPCLHRWPMGVFCEHFVENECVIKSPHSKVHRGQHRAHMGPVGPRWAPCWPHEPCYQWVSSLPRKNGSKLSE